MTYPSEIIINGYAFPAVVLVDPVTGQPVPVTTVVPTSGEVTVPGGVAIIGAVAVSGIASPVDVSGSSVNAAVTGTVAVSSAPPVTGTVAVSGVAADIGVSHVTSVTNPVSIAGTVPVSITAPALINANTTPTLPVSNVDPVSGLITSMIRDYLIEVGFLGNTGAYVGHRRVSILGNNPDVDTGTLPEDVWSGGGLYPWMTASTALEIVSSSAADAAAGTGARTVTINGLSAAWAEVSQTITLNGTTAVAIPTSLYRINSANIASAGTGKVNAGDLTIRDAGGGTTRGIIPTGYGTTRQSAFTVPAGYTLQILAQSFGLNRAAASVHATVQLISQSSLGFYRIPFEVGVTDVVPYYHDGTPGVPVPEKTDLLYRCAYVSGNNTDVSTSILGVMRLNGLT